MNRRWRTPFLFTMHSPFSRVFTIANCRNNASGKATNEPFHAEKRNVPTFETKCFNRWHTSFQTLAPGNLLAERKSYFVIVILGLLVLILTLFSMKQQNDYALLNDEYYRQGVIVRAMQMDVDSLKVLKNRR